MSPLLYPYTPSGGKIKGWRNLKISLWNHRETAKTFTMTYRKVTAKRNNPRFGFVNETIAELKKVVWLTRQEVIYLTTLVLLVCLTVGLILWIIDYGFTKLVNKVFLGG